MPQVFDNIDRLLLPALQSALGLSDRADFCVGYFNLRGWKELDEHIRHWSETEGTCRLLSDTLYFFDNSTAEPRLVFRDENGNVLVYDTILYDSIIREVTP